RSDTGCRGDANAVLREPDSVELKVCREPFWQSCNEGRWNEPDFSAGDRRTVRKSNPEEGVREEAKTEKFAMSRSRGSDQAPKKIRPFEPVAIIGMRGRFPGANDLETYWQNLAQGVESITILTQEEMCAAGIPDNVARLPG